MVGKPGIVTVIVAVLIQIQMLFLVAVRFPGCVGGNVVDAQVEGLRPVGQLIHKGNGPVGNQVSKVLLGKGDFPVLDDIRIHIVEEPAV